MASSAQLKALFHAHISGDTERFRSVALQVAAHEAKIGHLKLAGELRELVNKAKEQQQVVAISKGQRDSSGLLNISSPSTKLNDLILAEDARAQLDRVIKEVSHINHLRSHGLNARRKLLLVGPPGTGKTFTAAALAGELGYPLFEVRLDAVITKFMGETSLKLRQIFDSIESVRGVYFFDEFDALGADRSTGNDVGEARRVLNSLLTMIEQDTSTSLIICATNYSELLDKALFRRFDDVINYELPSVSNIEKLLVRRLNPYAPARMVWQSYAKKAEGLSAADIKVIADDVVKEMLISGASKFKATWLDRSIKERLKVSRSERQGR
ncbi:ATP-binding protein [Aliidiomarina halalkaliphila]|uniref:ATP-binding protein n=1 Tax=Aliidiomarina halalkaliphila TaxID=2593535 RepID=A0A552WZV7_9GAMM|nr:ATP-binding protein [Aliidiomarina halalkaliphila]TRW48360.1 ATP-binding protein [Aliidiomarina halalkaliphila]